MEKGPRNAVRGKRRSRKANPATFIADPIPERVCEFCNRRWRWKLSQTSMGQEIRCTCGASFCAYRTPQWCAP